MKEKVGSHYTGWAKSNEGEGQGWSQKYRDYQEFMITINVYMPKNITSKYTKAQRITGRNKYFRDFQHPVIISVTIQLLPK